MKTLLISLFCCLTLLNCSGQTLKSQELIVATVFAEKINNSLNPQILDVRTPKEFTSEHIDKAVNVNWNNDDFVANVTKFDKEKPVFVYCLSGGRSKQATQKLAALGFKAIYELDGGILKWKAAGLQKPFDKIIGMSSQEYDTLLNSDKKVLINFYAEWCAPCKKMAPYIEKMQKDSINNITIIRLDADENKTLITEMKIDQLPTLLLYENKQIRWKHTGFISEMDLKKQLQ